MTDVEAKLSQTLSTSRFQNLVDGICATERERGSTEASRPNVRPYPRIATGWSFSSNRSTRGIRRKNQKPRR